jgi:hypothetical protein
MQKTRAAVIDALHEYPASLPRERQFMMTRYRVADVAHRVVVALSRRQLGRFHQHPLNMLVALL